MNLYTSVHELTLELEKQKKNNNPICLVPTMGSLHEGHYSLVHKALEVSETVWVSIFINPTQFNDKNDFINYPKNLNKDIETLLDISKNIKIFAPSAKEIYGKNIESQKFDFGYIGEVMEGKFREDHFNGVATIVTKLLDLFKPDFIFFGEKDFQQILIVQQIIDESFHGTNLVRCETVRNKNEVIWSIYKNNFQSNSLNFSYSLENIRRLYNYYEKVMKYFKKKYPGRILTISYEDFIKNPNKQSKKIYDFCQLAWDNSYLNFQKKKIPIKSSSNSQLRDKIYKTAERNFENYRKLLS